MTATRSFTGRSDSCCMCGQPVPSTSATTTDPEAPEMIQFPPNIWAGYIQEDDVFRLIVCCSNACLRLLLREEP